MFNTTNYRFPQAVDQRVTVTENRAPTDESIRLLREMESKIEENWKNRLNLPSNLIKTQICKYHSPKHHYNEVYGFAININGKNIVIDVDPGHTTYKTHHDEFLKTILAEFSKALAVEILSSLDKTQMRTILS